MSKAENRFKRGLTMQAQQFRKAAQQLPSKDPQDSNYRRLRYCRYADDFALGFIGPKEEAEAIKQQPATFLREELKLSLSGEKTLITHARSSAAKFLGYEVTILQNDAKRSRVKRGNTERSFDQRSINAGIGLRIPQTVILDKCARYMKNGKPIHRSELEKRLLAQVCEVCEATRLTDQIEVHHLRALKDLKIYDGREKPRWVKIMAARKRKTLVLCRTCHADLHAGRPLKRAPVSRSRTEE